MALYKPYFELVEGRDNQEWEIRHNCGGAIGFGVIDKVPMSIGRLIVMAIEEGKRRRSRELQALLSDQ